MGHRFRTTLAGSALILMVAGMPTYGAPPGGPDPTARPRTANERAFPLVGRHFELSVRDALRMPGRFRRVVRGALPRGLLLRQGRIVGRADHAGFTKVTLTVDSDRRRPDRVQLLIWSLRPGAAKPGTRLLTEERRGNGPGSAFGVTISGNGQVVAYTASDSRLAPDDDNRQDDVLRWDRATGRTTLVARGPDGGAADGSSSQPSLSADGRYLAFLSRAPGLVPGDGAGLDVFLHDAVAGTTTLVSRGVTSSSGSLSWDRAQVTADGSAVIFVHTDFDRDDIFRWDRATGVTTRIDPPSAGARFVGSSADGRHTAWYSTIRDSPDDTVVVRNEATGAEAGRCVGNLDSVWTITDGSVSTDGDLVVAGGVGLPPGGGAAADSYGVVCDAGAGTAPAVRLNVSRSISADGTSVVVTSPRWRPERHRYLDLSLETPDGTVSPWRGPTSHTVYGNTAVSDDGRTVVYVSTASNLLGKDRLLDDDVYLWQRPTG